VPQVGGTDRTVAGSASSTRVDGPTHPGDGAGLRRRPELRAGSRMEARLPSRVEDSRPGAPTWRTKVRRDQGPAGAGPDWAETQTHQV
jgi:hypothetical protein